MSEEKKISVKLEDTNFNFTKLIKSKEYININTTPISDNEEENYIQIKNKSLFKIFNFFISSEEELENYLFSIITALIEDDNDENENEESEQDELDPIYIDILNKTKQYFITFGKNNDILLNYEAKKNVNISSYSLKNIFKKLNKSIIDMSDYLNIAILIFSPEEIKRRKDFMNKLTLKSKLLEMYSAPKKIEIIDGKVNFNPAMENQDKFYII